MRTQRAHSAIGSAQRAGRLRRSATLSLVLSALCVCCAEGTARRLDAAVHDGGSEQDSAIGDAGFADARVSMDAAPSDGSSPRDAGGGRADAWSSDASTPLDARVAAPDAGGGLDAGAMMARDAGPAPTPMPGTYRYRRLPVGGLEEALAVAFHPDGTYALVLARSGALFVYDWATEVSTRVPYPVASGRTMYADDLVFMRDGESAYIVGSERVGSSDEGAVYRWDDAAWRAGGAGALTRLSETRAGERFTGIALPIGGGATLPRGPIVLSASASPNIARLRELDTSTDTFSGLFVARATSAGCDDLAFANSEFGTWGVAIVCGSSGADAPYYTEVGGVAEWRAAPAATLGNTSSIASYPSGEYALAIGWSGRRVHRFQGGAWRPASSAPWFTTIGIWGVAFSPDGRRALAVGRAGRTPLRGAVLEYRHDLWSTADITDVSIPSFDAAPFLASSNTYLRDAAFHPACDGGLIVGGDTDFTGSRGMLIEFLIEGGRACP